MRTVQFYQIFYKEEQFAELYPFACQFYHSDLDEFFENKVIADLVPRVTATNDLIAVCSWRLKAKRQDSIRTKGELTYEKMCVLDYDVAILTPRSANHRPLEAAKTWHYPHWTPAIERLRDLIKIPQEVTHTIYENHFVADRDLYQDYVRRYLCPAIDFMKENPEIFRAPSGYAKYKTEGERKIIKEKLGLDDWPIGVFVLERLFSIYLQNEKKHVKVIPL
jgi:hypothetical protein